MKKYEALYDWPMAMIARVADSDEADSYAAGLTGDKLDAFAAVTEQLRGLGADMARAKATRSHFEKWPEVRHGLERCERDFGDFPGVDYSAARFFVWLADSVAQSGCAIDTVDIDASALEMHELQEPIPIAWFVQENGNGVLDSLIIFSRAALADFEAALAEQPVSPLLAFHVLAALASVTNLPHGSAAFVRRLLTPITAEAVAAFARLLVLSTGRTVHVAQAYKRRPSILNPDLMCIGPPYQQWSDILQVLSEYNSRDEVLLKFLTLYHVIEALMYKRPIVELEGQHGGRMFSLRDFQRLYRQLAVSEADTLKRLLETVWKLPAPVGPDIKRAVAQHWRTLLASVPQSELEGALRELGVSTNCARGGATPTPGELAQITYAVRNAVVHNKETEFHLTYATLSAAQCALLETVLLPSLEEMCFALIGSQNAEFWYRNQSIRLYA